MRADRGVHLHRHLGPRLAPQREFLQAPGHWPVTLLDRLEDPAAQPPYLLLMVPPVSSFPGITVERGQALRSVHRGAQLAHQFRHLRSLSPQRLTCPRQRSFEPGSKTGIRASYTRTLREEFPGPAVPLSCRLSAARHPLFWAPCPATGIQPPLLSAYRTTCAYPRLGYGPIAGFTRSARVRPGPPRPPPAASQRHVPVIPAEPPSPGRTLHEASARVSW